jgi:hypothetical protein
MSQDVYFGFKYVKLDEGSICICALLAFVPAKEKWLKVSPIIIFFNFIIYEPKTKHLKMLIFILGKWV